MSALDPDRERGSYDLSHPVRTGSKGEFCANCIGDLCGCPVHEEPIGRRGGIVRLCSRCATEPVRERDHLFTDQRGGAGFPDRPASGKKPSLS